MRAVFESLPGDGYFVQVPEMFHLNLTDIPLLSPLAYPMLAKEGADPAPFGAANTHAYFTGSFVELVTIISEGRKIPADANLIPLQVPSEHLAQVTESITRIVDRFAARLERFQGLHRLVFHSSDADAVAQRLTATGIVNSGVNTTQRPVDTAEGPKVETIRHIEIGTAVIFREVS